MSKLRLSLLAACAAPLLLAAAAPSSPSFSLVEIDPGAAESMAVADLNNDGKLDIISAESWYEAPNWTKRAIRTIPVSSGYVDSFSDLPMDVDGDGLTDIIQIGYFARRILWMKNPGSSGAWTENLIDAIGPTEFAFLVDLDNDSKSRELLPQFTTTSSPLSWYDYRDGKWEKHPVAARSFGHGIGVGDINGDKRNDIITPQGWLEAPADVRAAGEWKFHPADWQRQPVPPPPPGYAVSPTEPPAVAVPPAGTPPPVTQRGAEWGYLHVIDINGDGRNDILTSSAHSFGLVWFEQKADGAWSQHIIDHSWSHPHATVLADVNGDGKPDLVTGKRLQSRNAAAPGDGDPLGVYWYEFTRSPSGAVSWRRHTVAYGGKFGGGLQMAVRDMDGDGDADILGAGKSGLFLAVNRTR